MLNCSEIARSALKFSMVQSCDRLEDGSLRLSTPFLYPNGESIDVFLSDAHLLYPAFQLSDYGKTIHYLRTAQVEADSTACKKEIFEDIVARTGVHFASGDLFVELREEDLRELSKHILQLASVCTRVSDFAAHQRLRSSNPFRDDIEDFLEAESLSYVPGAFVAGRHGRVRVDFQALSPARTTNILTLGSLNEASAHASANEIFRKWHDLRDLNSANGVQQLTIYNSQSQAIKLEDLEGLQEYSNVISFLQEQELLGSLLAA